MEHPKVSVIMSVYNEEKYLRQALDSILSQTFADFEFIVVDDGSTDGTRSILESYRDPRIRVFSQDNQGLTKSLNRALSTARAGYIARMDGNDISRRERFERQINFLDRNPDTGIVGSFSHRIDEKGRQVNLYTYPTDGDGIREALWSTCPMCHSSVMFRRACVERVGPYREKVGPTEDLDFFFRVSEKFETANIPEPLHSFRVIAEGITIRRRFDQLRYELLVRMMARERKECGRDRLEEMSDDEISRLLDHLLPRTRRNEDKVLHQNWIHLAEVSYVSGDYGRSAQWLSKFIRMNPLSSRGWVLAAKLAACSIVAKDKLRRIRGVGHRQPGHRKGDDSGAGADRSAKVS